MEMLEIQEINGKHGLREQKILEIQVRKQELGLPLMVTEMSLAIKKMMSICILKKYMKE